MTESLTRSATITPTAPASWAFITCSKGKSYNNEVNLWRWALLVFEFTFETKEQSPRSIKAICPSTWTRNCQDRKEQKYHLSWLTSSALSIKPQPQGGSVATSLIPLKVSFQGGVKDAGFAWKIYKFTFIQEEPITASSYLVCKSQLLWLSNFKKYIISTLKRQLFYQRVDNMSLRVRRQKLTRLSLNSWSVKPMSSHVPKSKYLGKIPFLQAKL